MPFMWRVLLVSPEAMQLWLWRGHFLPYLCFLCWVFFGFCWERRDLSFSGVIGFCGGLGYLVSRQGRFVGPLYRAWNMGYNKSQSFARSSNSTCFRLILLFRLFSIYSRRIWSRTVKFSWDLIGFDLHRLEKERGREENTNATCTF